MNFEYLKYVETKKCKDKKYERLYKFKKDNKFLDKFELVWNDFYVKNGCVKILVFKDENDLKLPYFDLKTIWYNTDGKVIFFKLEDGSWTNEIDLNKLIGILY